MRVRKWEVAEPQCGLYLLPLMSSDFPSVDSVDQARPGAAGKHL